LRRIERWAHANAVAVELTGLDLNPDAVAIAAEATPSTSLIRWVAADVFRGDPASPLTSSSAPSSRTISPSPT
jgi:hypothetical protein